MTRLDVLCVGVATLDRLVVVDALPGDDERVLVDPFVVAGGGPAATAAVALARLGARVALSTVVGSDEAGRQVLAGLEAEGVDLRWAEVRDDVRTTESIVFVNRRRQTRTIVTTPSRAPAPGSVPVAVAPWVHVDQTGYSAVRAAMSSSPAVPSLSVDAGNGIDDLDLAGIALYAPTLGRLQARHPTGDIAASLSAARTAGAATVVATAGSDGAYVLDGDELVHVPAVATDVVSTLGAGDVFHGALLAAVVAGAGHVQAVRIAAAAAAASCRALDGRSAIPRVADPRDLLEVELGSFKQEPDGVAQR